MKKTFLISFIMSLLLLMGCSTSTGVSQEEYDTLLSENEELKEKLAQYEQQSGGIIESDDIGDYSIDLPSEADFLYVDNGSEVQINGYQGDGGDIVIPDEIEGMMVTRIADFAFQGEENITGVVLPEGLEYIGAGAFDAVTELTGILVVPETVIEIGSYAFEETGLTGIIIQSDCEIGDSAFDFIDSLEFIFIKDGMDVVINDSVSYNDELKVAIIPESVSEIEDGSFTNCNYLTIYTPSGSYAEKYAKENFINVDTESYDEQLEKFAEIYTE